ncbi:hypothetical protein JIW86_08240 [Streptomyces sp. NBC_00162]|nr:hypothetical protein [Streptomyces sp. NBC_00162]UUU38796.1 hypothetical protein JIW86_08240 [Streptomyces sp. NBC_00162]
MAAQPYRVAALEEGITGPASRVYQLSGRLKAVTVNHTVPSASMSTTKDSSPLSGWPVRVPYAKPARVGSYAVQITSHGALIRSGPRPIPTTARLPGRTAPASARTRIPEVRWAWKVVTATPAASKAARPWPIRVRWCRWW